MTIHKLIIALAGLASLTLAHATAAAEAEAKIAAGGVGINRSQEEFKGKLDKHVEKELTCSVGAGAIGQFLSADVPSAVGQFVGCAAPTPVCFYTPDKLEENRKDFLSGINTRWGAKLNLDMRLPSIPECAIEGENLAFNLDVDAKQLVTGVKAWIEIKFDLTYLNSQKMTFVKNLSYPQLEKGSSLPSVNGKVITAYANYDRKFGFGAKVEYDGKVNSVDVKLNLSYDKKNVHYCKATHVVDMTPKIVDCPVK